MRLVMVSMQVVQAHVPQGPGRYQKACIIITDQAVYLAQNGERDTRKWCSCSDKISYIVQALEYVRYSQYNSIIHFFSLSL